MSRMTEFLRTQENDKLAGGDISAIRHTSREGGLDTVGFGHKLTQSEKDSGAIYGMKIDTLDAQQAEAILQKDIKSIRRTLNQKLKNTYGIPLSSLTSRQQDMLTDYEFNVTGGINKFPKFTKAVLTNNPAIQLDEMTRTFKDSNDLDDKGKPKVKSLARNSAFYNTFMSREAQTAYGELPTPQPLYGK